MPFFGRFTYLYKYTYIAAKINFVSIFGHISEIVTKSFTNVTRPLIIYSKKEGNTNNYLGIS